MSTKDTAFYPTDAPAGVPLKVYVFVVGTSATPKNYKETLDHVASHGFLALGVGNHNGNSCNQQSATSLIDRLNDLGLPVEVDSSSVVLGGHSGGGPCALWAAGDRPGVVRGAISQHGAAVPGINRLTAAQIAKLPSKVMTLCGTRDTVAYCGCSSQESAVYSRLPATSSKIGISVTGVTHNGGTQGSSGNTHEGGYVVAFCYSVLNEDQAAGQALADGATSRGDKFQSAHWPSVQTGVIV